jgi:DNA polymerase-4
VLAKNEIAKSYGVKTAEAIWQAKQKCPDLITLPPDYEKYEQFSRAAKAIYEKYTDKIEPFGIDECWLDVTGSTMLFGTGEEIAHKIRREIKETLGITVSVGVSFNKIFAKLGSDMKKPDAVTVISPENFREKVHPLPVGDLLFVGKNTAQKLNSIGVFSIGDLTLIGEESLRRILGKNGLDLRRYALGLDNSPVSDINDKTTPKSIGKSVTGGTDFTNNDEVWQTILALSEEISEKLRRERLYAGGVQVHIRDAEFVTKEPSRALATPTDLTVTIAEAAMALFKESYFWELPLRSVGVRAIHLKSDVGAEQTDIFSDAELSAKKEKLEDSVHAIREKFGKEVLKRGTVIIKKDV